MDKSYTNKEYEEYVKKKTPNSKTVINMIKAFIVGGLICILGQGITDFLKSRGVDVELVPSITSMILLFIGSFLTGINIYDELGKFAGAGSIVPITGFANSIVAPAMEFKSEGYVMGVGAKMFLVAGPVLVYGTVTSVISGIIYYLLK